MSYSAKGKSSVTAAVLLLGGDALAAPCTCVLTGLELPLWLILFVLNASPDMTRMSGLYLGVFAVTTLTTVLTRPPDLLRTLDAHLGAALLCALPLIWLSS